LRFCVIARPYSAAVAILNARKLRLLRSVQGPDFQRFAPRNAESPAPGTKNGQNSTYYPVNGYDSGASPKNSERKTTLWATICSHPFFSAGAYYPNTTVQPIMYGRCHLWQRAENRLSRHSHVVDVGLGRCGFSYRLPTGAFGACGHGVSPGAHSLGCVARTLSTASFNHSGGFSFSSIP